MNINNLRNIILGAVIVAISGCATTTGSPGCGMFSVNGEMSIQMSEVKIGSLCTLNLTYTNKSNKTVKPRIQAIFYDGQGNTITEKTSLFNNIDPGRSQTMGEHFLCNGQTTKKISIKEAVDTNTCSKSGCFRICGVYQNSYFLNSQAYPVKANSSRDVNPTTDAPQGTTPKPSSTQKEKWVTTMAQLNGCESPITVSLKSQEGLRENYEAKCANKSVEITCEFDGPVEARGAHGLPSVLVTGKSYTNKPACWR